jgi:uronate dehydrogenase
MKLLLVGGAGYVATTIRPGLEAVHECHFFDRVPVRGGEGRATLGQVTDPEKIRRSVAGMDAVVYLAMGTVGVGHSRTGHRDDVQDLAAAFAVNTGGWYGFIAAGLEAGVRRFVYSSSLSVFSPESPPFLVTDDRRTNAWHPYGVSKRLGELVCGMAHERQPDATFVCLRLMAPRNAEHFAARERMWGDRKNPMLGPEDTTRLYLAAVGCDKPGVHLAIATGDVDETHYRHDVARRVLGWRPEGR